jgi:hypothetical protein
MKRPRLLELERGAYLVVADAPADRYGEEAINRRLSNLEWVSRAAIAHEAVVESFIGEKAVVPMKLFTIFATDDSAIAHVRGESARIRAALARVTGHQEWGVRVVLDRSKTAAPSKRASAARATKAIGRSYLSEKKAQRDAADELVRNAREAVADLYDRLATAAGLAKKRSASEMPIQGGPLLLDAAFLVPSKKAARFRALAARQARALARAGYHITLSGPWPAYSFIQD